MGISRDSRHKKAPTGARRANIRIKRKFELGRQPSNTKLGSKRIRKVRVRGGNIKMRALRLDTGNYSWASEGITRKTRIISVVYNSANNELVRTNTLVKGCIVQIDATPFRQWYESHYALPLSRKKKGVKTGGDVDGKESNEKENEKEKEKEKTQKSEKNSSIEPLLLDQFLTGRLLAIICSRPGQTGNANGYVLEGKELEFYWRKIKAKK